MQTAGSLPPEQPLIPIPSYEITGTAPGSQQIASFAPSTIAMSSAKTEKKESHKYLQVSVIGKTTISVLKETAKSLIYHVANLLNRLFQNIVYQGEAKLLTADAKIAGHHQAWFLNLSLLRQAAESLPADSPEREQLRFMAANYLHKTAPLQMKTQKHFLGNLTSTFQSSKYENKDNLYHRFSLKHQLKLASGINQQLALRDKSPLLLTDTAQFQHLLPLKFCVSENIDLKSDSTIKDALTHHFQGKDPLTALKSSLSSPILFDLTGSLGADLGKEREPQFKEKLKNFTKDLNTSISDAVENFVKEHPELAKHKKELKAMLQHNITCICRVDRDDVKGLKVLPLFTDITGPKVLKAHHDLTDFIISTGIGIGSVNVRRQLLDAFSIREDVRYAPQASSTETPTLYYPTIDSFTQTAFYKRLSSLFGPASPLLPDKPHIALLGKASLDLLTGLLCKIDPAKWEELNKNPALSQVLQNTLFKIREQLATAELQIDDYNRFATSIELVQSEIAALLELVRPYKDGDFEEIFKATIKPDIPEGLHKYLKAGLGKTAINTFAGINEAISKSSPTPQRVYSRGFYFEQAGLVGYDSTFDAAMNNQDPKAPKIDLYCGQFNSNIEIESDFTHYERRDVAQDVRKLLDSGKAADHLTVAVDITIDEFHSKNVHDLLKAFEKEIEAGKVNFAFFRSGQKMDMLGMDNYYGAPFYMVNNADTQWKAFDALRTHPVHQTDSLSTQWFCLSNQHIPDSLATYRKLIFDNTREILRHIPESLKPAKSQQIRVNTADEKMNPAFIDVKVLGLGHKIRSMLTLGVFYKMMVDRGIKLQTRATFGLYHPNALIISVNEVKGSSSLRLHPGLNPKENAAFIEFFQMIAKSQEKAKKSKK